MFPNDEVVAYGRANGLGSDYNDIMTAFLRDYYSSNLSLTDLWGRAWAEGFRSINGFTDFPGIANSEFYAPLTHSLVLTRGVGGPTYSRATNAWEFDNEGKLITVPSGAARFGGARLVYNMCGCASSEVFTAGVGWNLTGLSAPSDNILLSHNSTSAQRIADVSVGPITTAGEYYTVKFRVKYIDIRYVQIAGTSSSFGSSQYANFDLVDKVYSVTGCTAGIDDAGDGEIDIYATFLAISTAANSRGMLALVDSLAALRLDTFTGDGIKSLNVVHYQFECVTGAVDKTPNEYVSKGVLSAPYHGAGVDGVKYFDTNKDGSAISASSLLGYHAEGARTNTLLYSRDLTKAAWVKTNVTAANTATGIDNVANSASTLTATAADATILQTLTLAAVARSFSAYVKRRTGTGNVYITRDGGTNWTDVTSQINSSTWTRVKIENTSVLNPQVGFKIATSGDAIDVDVCQDEAGAEARSPIVTTTATVTRNADAETFQTASNWSDTAGWALATVQGESWAKATGTAIGNGTAGLKLSASDSGVVAYDGTNTVNGPAGSPSGAEKLAITWGSGALQAASGGVAGSAGSYDGAWGLATVGIGTSQGNVYIKDVYIGQSALTADQLAQVTS